ncbi:hypothetical protein EJB05_05562 [Eragrostis curvula]|uniref:Uncharacterized protein n=1 Tax=Eragrostis curvula TaxID=38414 RepID=A0A5J9WDQ8_9POAL|nr:hypothetical protein EJB05_05562 [Eragrostis curvula]
MRLMKEEYLEAIPWWMAAHRECWKVLVDKWCAEDWAAMHEACRQRRLMMQGQGDGGHPLQSEDPPEAYSNLSIHSCLSSYSEVAKEVHGQDYDPRSHDLDRKVVMRAGGGKKHGRYYLGDSVIDTASTPTLSQIHAQSVSDGPSIRQRPTATQALQAQLEEERIRREQLKATLA